jgi:maltose-binding protein MalE
MLRCCRPLPIRLSLLLLASGLMLVSARPTYGQIALRLWHSWRGQPAALLTSWIDAYNEARTGRAVVELTFMPAPALLTHLSDANQTDQPDAVLGPSDWAGQLISARRLAQLDGRISADLEANAAQIAWGLASYDARVIGLPLLLETTALYINTNAPATAQTPATFTDLLAASKGSGLIMARDFSITAGFFYDLGGQLLTPRGENLLDSESGRAALIEYLAGLRRLASAEGLTLDAPDDAFRAGQTEYLIGSSWQWPVYKANPALNISIAPLPALSNGPWRPLVRAWLLYSLLGSEQQTALLDLALFLSDSEAQTLAAEAGFLPVNTSALANLADTNLRAVAEQAFAGQPLSNRAEMAVYWVAMRRAVDSIARGGAAAAVADEVLRSVRRDLDLLQGR